MKKRLVEISFFTFFLCANMGCKHLNNGEHAVYQGELSELLDGDFVLEKDYETKYIHDLRTVSENEHLIYILSGLPDHNGQVIKFFDTKGQEKFQHIKIPREGPESIKGGSGGRVYLESLDELYVISALGTVGKYNAEGKKLEEVASKFSLPSKRDDFITMESRNGLMYKDGDWVQLGQNPSNIMKFFDPKERLAKSEFPLDFTSWLSQINVKTGDVRHSDFKIPGGYEIFQNDLTSTYLMGAFHHEKGEYFLAWPYSDTLYKLKDLKLIEKFRPVSNQVFNYMPSEVIPWGGKHSMGTSQGSVSSCVFTL